MGKSVLAVDDSKSILQMVAFTLKGAGYDVGEAENGEDALAKAKGGSYNLIITDLNMPKMDGLALIKALRGEASYKFTPILMLTTEAGDSMKAKGKELGATGWLVKPFDPEKLLEVVKKVIG
ncbi:MAG TPA: response regulator [Geobacterales bacterium]|nr:response regulator [Geobacterales bacterium]